MEKLVDKNQLIGIVLLMCMWAGYMYFMPQTPPEQPAKVAPKTEAKAKAPAKAKTASATKKAAPKK